MLQKLSLESAFDDTPETRLMVAIFEQDTSDLLQFMKGLLNCNHQLVTAQRQVTDAVRAMADHLRSYPAQRLLESDFDLNIVQEFSETIEELGSLHQSVGDHLTESVSAPIHRYIDKELQELITVGKLYNATAEELDQTLSRYARASTRPRPELQSERVDAAHAAYVCRKKYHQMALLYFNKMNLLQHSRKLALLDPLLGFVQAFRSFHSIGNGTLNAAETDKFLSGASQMSQCVQDEIGAEMAAAADAMDSIIGQSENQYAVLPTGRAPAASEPSVTIVTSSPPAISGYLFIKTRYLGVMAQWERAFFFTEGYSLMVTGRRQLAGSLCVELDASTICQPLSGEDRAGVFQISTNTKSVILQALNDQARDQWLVGIGHLLHSRRQPPPAPLPSAGSTGAIGAGAASGPGAGGHSYGSILSGVSQFFIGKLHGLGATGPDSDASRGPQTTHLDSARSDESVPIMFQLPWSDDDQLVTPPAAESAPSAGSSPGGDFGPELATGGPGQCVAARHLGSVPVASDRGHRLVTGVIDRLLLVRRRQHTPPPSPVQLQVALQSLVVREAGTGQRVLLLPYSRLSFWTSHLESERLMGLICLDERGALWCHVLETDSASQQLCSALTQATAAAYRRQSEAQLLLNNIRLQPDLSPEAAAAAGTGGADSSQRAPPADVTQLESEA